MGKYEACEESAVGAADWHLTDGRFPKELDQKASHHFALLLDGEFHERR